MDEAQEEMKLSYWTKRTMFRLVLTFILIYFIEKETGPITAVVVLLITMSLEGLGYAVRLLAMGKLFEMKAFGEALKRQDVL